MSWPCGRGSSASWTSARHCTPPYWKWWGKAGPLDDIWWKNKGSGKKFWRKQQSEKSEDTRGQWGNKENNGKYDCQQGQCNMVIYLGYKQNCLERMTRKKQWEFKLYKWMKLHLWYKISNLKRKILGKI